MRITGGNTRLDNLRWRIAIKMMRWTVAVMPEGSAKMLLHEMHLDWCSECRRHWELRYGKAER